MRKFNVKTWLAALVMLLLPCVAGATGLGRLTMLSALGQPLVAEIDLVSVTREEMSSLSARLAQPESYRQANLQHNSALTGARLTIEKRPNGQPYLKITSTRPVNEPFIDLLVELTWASGRLSREYTALLDPPGVPSAPPAPVISAVPESRPLPDTGPPPQTGAPSVSRPVTPAGPLAGGKEYGPIQRGETLGKIAKSVMPEGVTLEQMLVALYRSNPDAFIRKNLNLVRTGKILRVPDKEEVAAIARGEAVKEFRAHVADWNAYRQKLADTAGTVPAEGRAVARGRITAKVEDKGAGGAPKDVVRVSKGESPGKGKPRSRAERARALEEEAVTREKALTEAGSRVTQLEKTVQDMKKLAELKSPGMAAAQQQAQQATAKPEEKKPDAVAVATPESAKPDEKKADQTAVPAPAGEKKDKPKPKPAPTPPPKEPELMDQVLDAVTDPVYLGVAGGIIVIGGLAAWMMRRRRARASGADGPAVALKPGQAAAATAAVTAAATAEAAAAAPAEDVDPLAEAEVYIAYGRDGQAEEILKEALSKNPTREDVQLKLLEIYAARKDKDAYGKFAGALNKQTGGAGNNWIKAAAMGYALDAANPMYAAGKDAVVAAPSQAGGADVDLDLGLGDASAATDIVLDAGTADAAGGGEVVDLGAAEAPAEPAPDFALEVPPAAAPPEVAQPAQDTNMLDFQIELPQAGNEPAAPAAQPAAAASGDGGLDFKLDDLNLSLDGDAKAGAAAGGEKDSHWYDVQTKFDLAKAYQEMGDKDGAKEILQEVLKEGDTEQKAQAKTLMDSLG